MSKQRINQEARKKRINHKEALVIETKPEARSKREIEDQAKLEARRERRKLAKELREKIKQSRKELAERKKAEGISRPPQNSVSNAKCSYKTEEEEQAAREEAVAAQISTYRAMLPQLLKDFSKIPDPRTSRKPTHMLTTLLLYGILHFVFQITSRREANKEMSRPSFFNTLKSLFPELESLPHTDTLARLLEKIDVLQIEHAHIELIKKFNRNKNYSKYLISKCYPIAIDGTQKHVINGDNCADEWLERRLVTKEGEQSQQYVYVVEANLVFHNGMTLPLFTEFLSFLEGDPDDHKQDCELKAFKRLSKKLHTFFPRLPIIVLLDGLYPNGPLMQSCLDYDWQFMIVLKNKSLPKVWNAAKARQEIGFNEELEINWKGRRQYFWWTNNIEHIFNDNGIKKIVISLVVCIEEFEDVDNKTGNIVTKEAFHAWISSHPLNRDNINERCNFGARYRWGIENSIQTEKRGGYSYEHIFSHNWNAMKGYHYLMRLAHLMNAIALHTKRVAKQVKTMGIQAFIKFVRETCANRWLRPEWIKELLVAPFQFHFV